MSILKSYTVIEATRNLEKYCVYQERCYKEVFQKLKTMGIFIDAQEVIVLHLLNNDFLNEERFAKSYVRGKFNVKKWGRNKITNELRRRDISAYNIKSGLSEIDMDMYLNAINLLVKKKIATVKAENEFILRKKVTNFLLSKGYEISLIIDAINNAIKNKSN